MKPPIQLVRETVAEVARQTGIGPKDIESNAKYRHIVKARREVWKRLHSQGYSLRGIGMAWGCAHQIIRVGVMA
jgi:hypothetical protein